MILYQCLTVLITLRTGHRTSHRRHIAPHTQSPHHPSPTHKVIHRNPSTHTHTQKPLLPSYCATPPTSQTSTNTQTPPHVTTHSLTLPINSLPHPIYPTPTHSLPTQLYPPTHSITSELEQSSSWNIAKAYMAPITDPSNRWYPTKNVL
jgi:hypothetical protein